MSSSAKPTCSDMTARMRDLDGFVAKLKVLTNLDQEQRAHHQTAMHSLMDRINTAILWFEQTFCRTEAEWRINLEDTLDITLAPFRDGYALATNEKTGAAGILRENGTWYIPLSKKFTPSFDPRHGLWSVRDGNGYPMYLTEGGAEIIIPSKPGWTVQQAMSPLVKKDETIFTIITFNDGQQSQNCIYALDPGATSLREVHELPPGHAACMHNGDHFFQIEVDKPLARHKIRIFNPDAPTRPRIAYCTHFPSRIEKLETVDVLGRKMPTDFFFLQTLYNDSRGSHVSEGFVLNAVTGMKREVSGAFSTIKAFDKGFLLYDSPGGDGVIIELDGTCTEVRSPATTPYCGIYLRDAARERFMRVALNTGAETPSAHVFSVEDYRDGYVVSQKNEDEVCVVTPDDTLFTTEHGELSFSSAHLLGGNHVAIVHFPQQGRPSNRTIYLYDLRTGKRVETAGQTVQSGYKIEEGIIQVGTQEGELQLDSEGKILRSRLIGDH